MRNVLTGAAILLVMMVLSIVVNVICNQNGVELNSTVMSMTSTFVAILLYHWLTRKTRA